MTLTNFRSVNSFVTVAKIEERGTIRVIKGPKVKEFDEATFARLIKSDFKNGSI